MSIRYRDKGTSVQRLRTLPSEVRLVADKTAKNLRLRTIDAKPKESASEITKA